MSRDFDRISKEINKSHNELYSKNSATDKDIYEIKKDISFLKENVQKISEKMDELIDIMGNLTIMFVDEEDLEDEDNYDTDQTWVPEEDSDWKEMDDNY